MGNSKQKHPEVFAYLDHNVLDAMTKGDPLRIKDLLKDTNLTPVYSNESLKEIHRSKGYEHTFLELLEAIGAKHIEAEFDQSFRATGRASICPASAKEQYDRFLSQQTESQEGDYGLGDLLLKLYGGKPDTSFAEVYEAPIERVMRNLLLKLDALDLNEIPEDMRPHVESIRALAPELPEILKEQAAPMISELDNMEASHAEGFEAKTGIGPSVLNNINPPHVVQQVWDLVSSRIDTENLDLELFFGLKQPYGPDPERELTPQEMVNAIYHQLNYIGYYRDSKIRNERRFKASFSDMTHAGLAAFCPVLISRDANLVMKAKAAYEHLGIKTLVLFYPSKKHIGSNMLLQLELYKAASEITPDLHE